MDLFRFVKSSFAPTMDANAVAAHYQRLRPVRFRLNNELVRRLPPNVLNEGAKKLGILRGGTFVFDDEDEASVLMDYCIYDVRRHGRNAVEQYLSDCPPDPDSDKMACLRAMQHATYTLIAVLRIEPGVGCHMRNLFAEETRLLADIGFSETAQPGTLVATRLLDFGGFVTTSGAGLPVGILDEHGLDEWQRKLSACANHDHFDPAPLIRSCLKHGASSRVRYETPSIHRRSDVGEDFPTAGPSAPRSRARARHRAGKPVSNRRCRCGSGKMFKNCCAKRDVQGQR